MGASLHTCCHAVQLGKEDSGVGGLFLATQEMKFETLHTVMLGEVDISTSWGCGQGCGHPQRGYTWSVEQQDLSERLAALIGELFCLQDLNSDGVLDENELVVLNENIAMLHYGQDVDKAAVKKKYKTLFRKELDADGHPVPVAIFRRYVQQVLHDLDPDPAAQEMILEQFIIEARTAREIFWNVTDTAAVIQLTGRQSLTVCGIDDVREVQCRGDVPCRSVSDISMSVSTSASSCFSA